MSDAFTFTGRLDGVEETVKVRSFQVSLGDGMMPLCSFPWQVRNSPILLLRIKKKDSAGYGKD